MKRNRIVVAGLSAFLLLLLGLGYWGANRALRTIRELDARAQRVLREQLGETVEITPSGNEVEGLMKSFDMLVDAFTSRATALSEADAALKLQHEALEKTVAARTVEIESANRMLAARERQTRAITDLTGLLQTVHDIDEAARILPRFLGPLFAPHAGALYIAKPSLNYLETLVRWGDASFIDSFDFSDCWALRRGEAYAVDGSGLICPHSDAHAAHDYLCAPMVLQGTTFGLLHVAYASAAADDAAKRERREHARYITEQLTLALANLRLREALRNQALRDPLTGLFNRRYLEESLERELARAKRENQPLSLLMLDVDHFKNFNDTNGHEAGDAVLRALGRTLIECTRGGDIACRFGGEEFAVMLIGADPDQAAAWATRLIERVRTLTVRADGQMLAGVTISLGLTCYPMGGQDAEGLVRAADAALYEAKRAGRDRLVMAEEIASAAA